MIYGHFFGGTGMLAMALLWLICTLLIVSVIWGFVALFRIQKDLAAHNK